MDAAFHAALQQTRQHFRHLGLTVPPAMDKELAEVDKVIDRSRGIEYDPTKLTQLVWDALEAGRNPVTDKAVAAQLSADLLSKQDLGPRLHSHADALRAEVFRRHAAAILSEMGSVVTDADQVLAAAHAAIPNLDVVDTNSIHVVPAKHATTWALAREATTRLERVQQVWERVTMACRLVPPATGDPNAGALILADLDANELDSLGPVRNSSVGAGWLVALVQSGHRLDYAADPDEYRERRSIVEQQRAEQARERAATEDRRLGRPAAVRVNGAQMSTI